MAYPDLGEARPSKGSVQWLPGPIFDTPTTHFTP
jgi:hypothetical protein